MPTKRNKATAAGADRASLAHRVLLDHRPGFRPFRGGDLFGRIGGQPTVDELVNRLYDGIADDPGLRPLFPRDLTEGRSMSKLFFAEWLGGPGRYSEEAHAALRHRHDDVPITRALAGRWLGHFRRALEATVAAEADTIFEPARALAQALVNDQADTGQVAWCGIGARTVKRATTSARRGDVAGIDAAVAEAPHLLRPTYVAAILQAAALAGRTEVIQSLLDRGIGPDHPHFLPVKVAGAAFEQVLYVTPLCAARLKRRPAVEALLQAAGARDDVFTAAFLGDDSALARMLAAEPDLAGVPDPAVDVLDITPAEHAVAGRQLAALRLILDHATNPAGVRALRGAAAQSDVTMVELLLAHGADATRIGVGRWVLHPDLAPLLAAHGAAVDSSGAWIGASCTGNQGRKDDPDYVEALLKHGARVDDRRSIGGQGRHATALHYAAKAGFLRTIAVLLEHGADPVARDAQGRTPLDWLDEATPRVPRAEVRNLLMGRSYVG
jgi:truncated hemoglobin YjbI/ankyrin repeat protein